MVEVQNLIRQHSHFFEQLMAAKKIRAYMAHGEDYQKKLSAKLEKIKAAEATTQKVVVEGTNLLRKAELKNDMLQVEICQLKLDMAALKSSKTITEEKSA